MSIIENNIIENNVSENNIIENNIIENNIISNNIISNNVFENKDEYKSLFDTKNRIRIRNFLKPEIANDLYDFLQVCNENWWFYSIYYDNERKTIRNDIENYNDIELEREKVYKSVGKGMFSYIFCSTTNHYDTCYCKICEVEKLLQDDEVFGFLNDITNTVIDSPLTTITEVFASRYKANDFLGLHHDKNKGRLAFVLGMTKGWRSDWGGNLIFTKTDMNIIEDVLVPDYNTLDIFYVPDEGTNHYVSNIVPYIDHTRFSITGWMK